MRNHIITLWQFQDIIMDIKMVQDWINGARVVCSDNQHMQLELDRQQAELDNRKAALKHQMAAIAMSN